jgi:hypothetical protein
MLCVMQPWAARVREEVKIQENDNLVLIPAFFVVICLG